MRSVFRFDGGEFHPNFRLNADLRREHTLDGELQRLAQEAALGARELAFRVAYDSGDYYRSIRGGLATNRRGLPVGRVAASDFKAHWIERGHRKVTVNGRVFGFAPGKQILARGGRRAGLRVRGRRR